MDYEWRSKFFICPRSPEKWDRLLGVDYTEELEGPSLPEFALIYAEHCFMPNPKDIAVTSYLIARTFAAFGSASDSFRSAGLAIFAAFHDQEAMLKFV